MSAGLEQVTGTRVSAGFFRTLGMTPTLGRGFLPAEGFDSDPGAPGGITESVGRPRG